MRSLLIAALLYSSLAQLTLIGMVWARRSRPAARPLLALAAIFAIWAFSSAMDLASTTLPGHLFWMQLRFTFTCFVPPLTLQLVIADLGLPPPRRGWQVLAALFPLLTVAQIWSMPYHRLFRYDFHLQTGGEFHLLAWTSGPGYWLSFAYTDVLVLAAAVLLLRSIAAGGPVRRRQSALILGALLLPFLTDTLFIFGFAYPPGFNATPLMLIATGGIVAYALLRYRWLELLPLARSTLLDRLPDGVVALDRSQRVVDLNPAAGALLLLDPPAALGRPLLQAVGHLDLQAVEQARAVQGQGEVSLRAPTGEMHYYDLQAIDLRTADGGPAGRLFLFSEVTRHKLEELRLRQLTQALEQSPAAVMFIGLDGRIEYVNPQFTALTGYTSAEALGSSPRALQPEDAGSHVYDAMWQALQAGQAWRGELLNRRKNGARYWEAALVAPTFDDQGRPTGYVAIKEDVTPRRTAEHALLASSRQLEARIAQVAALQAELREQAIRDPLTGLFNRRYLDDALERMLARARRDQAPLSLLVLDIDHFKAINDTHGHRAGDLALQRLAGLLLDGLHEGEIACRYGGEEFVVALPGCGLEQAARRAEALRLRVAGERFSLPTGDLSLDLPPHDHPDAGHTHPYAPDRRAPDDDALPSTAEARLALTVSLGLAACPQHADQPAELLRLADAALYRAKSAGRNRLAVWAAA